MKILVISIAGIGDSLIASPLIRELRESFPKASIDSFVMWGQSKKLLENNPYVDNIYQFNMVKEGYVKSLLYCLKLRRKKYDISINTHPQSKIQYRIIARLINARRRLSHLYDNKNFLDRFLINRGLEQDYGISSIDNNLNLLKLIGVKPKFKDNYKIFLSENDKEKASEFIKKNNLKGKIIGFHVGSGTTKNLALRRWPLNNYIKLIKKILKEDKKVYVLLFGGLNEVAENQEIIRKAKDRRVLLVKTDNIRETAAIVKYCNILVSGVTVMMHIASAMKVRQIVIAGPTYDKGVEPKSKPIVIKSDIECRPCYRYDGKGIRCTQEEKMRCLKEITPDRVYGIVKKIIK